MAKLVYLFAFVAFVQVATALDCYKCEKDGCQEDMAKWQKVPGCGKTTVSDKLVGACLKQVYTDKTTNKETTVRRCVIADKATDGSVSYKCNDNEGKVSSCHVCTTDFCNSAPAISVSFVTLLGVVAAYLIPRYM